VTNDIDTNLRVLRQIRSLAYEDTNQILHEALLLKAIEYLQNEHTQSIDWSWNPRQTGDSVEPDLQGKRSQEILISAEATTSEDPQGLIDQRMRKTLKKLSSMPGELFYFVQSERMRKRALTKISKAAYQIRVVLIAGS
jgi:hypothetical protein